MNRGIVRVMGGIVRVKGVFVPRGNVAGTWKERGRRARVQLNRRTIAYTLRIRYICFDWECYGGAKPVKLVMRKRIS